MAQIPRKLVDHNGFHRTLLIAILTLPICGCSRSDPANRDEPRSVLRLATTTSTRDSGLLEELLPAFEKQYECRVDVVAAGTGAALELGKAGDADVLIVHARDAEEDFMQAGYGIRHEEFMQNSFVILGPADDPAGIRDLPPVEAFEKIADSQHPFVSRGDDSGTHQREQQLWDAAGGFLPWDDYWESGQGMGPSLIIADERRAYLLCDFGTFLNYKDRMDLVPFAKNSPRLRNPYAVIVVNPETHPGINTELANALADFLIAEETQRRIRDYRIHGQALFVPTRLPEK